MIIHESLIFCYTSYQGYRREALDFSEFRYRIMVQALSPETTSIPRRWSVKRTGRHEIAAPGSGSNSDSVVVNTDDR